MDPASGNHEGNVEENTVDLLTALLPSDEDTQGPDGDFEGPPQQATVPRPTVGGKGVLASVWEAYKKEEADEDGESDSSDSEVTAQRAKFDEVHRYSEVLDSIAKKEAELDLMKRTHKAGRKPEVRQVVAACEELRKVESTSIGGREFHTAFERKAIS